MHPRPNHFQFVASLGLGRDHEYRLVRDHRFRILRSIAVPRVGRPAPPPVVPQLAGFEFIEPLGCGAFGEVWLARDCGLGALRAIKFVPTASISQSGLRRLEEEAQLMASLPELHPHRVPVHQFRITSGTWYLVMGYVPGGPLSWQAARGRPMSWIRATKLVAQTAQGLGAVHARGLVHRDINPKNILWNPQGGVDVNVYERPDEQGDHAVLGDFGIADCIDQRGLAGTGGYIAPELFTGGKASPCSDVYSLAATLLHLGTGERPPQPPTNPVILPDDLPVVVRETLQAGLAELDQRHDLPAYLARLWQTHWRLVADRLQESEVQAHPVRLDVRLEDIASAQTLRPVQGAYDLHIGDTIRVRAGANADGYFTLLRLCADGDFTVDLPSPGQSNTFCQAGNVVEHELHIAEPAGRDRLVVVWTRKQIVRDTRWWQRRLETGGLLDPDDTDPEPPGPQRRGAHPIGPARINIPSQGDSRAVVVVLNCRQP